MRNSINLIVVERTSKKTDPKISEFDKIDDFERTDRQCPTVQIRTQ